MSLPRVILTGASGFLGRHVVDALRDTHTVVAIARRSQQRAGVPEHPNVQWKQADIGERPQLQAVFDELRDQATGRDLVIHLAAYYDYTGQEHPEYQRTNIKGLRNLLELCAELRIARLVFASSLAACRFPPPGRALSEVSAPDGDHVYARSKRDGEAMLREYQSAFPSIIVRLAALFSDWCEYPPLFVFLNTWLSGAWNARILGGQGRSALPYLHVRDAAALFKRVLEREADFGPGDVLVASPNTPVSHRDLFATATLAYYGRRVEPICMPRPLCGPGIIARDILGRVAGSRPFERLWMSRYIDREMRVDGTLTRQLLGWAPRDRLSVLRRLPFLVENMKTDPLEWNRRNEAVMKAAWVSDYLKIYGLLLKHETEIVTTFSAALMAPEQQEKFVHYQQLSTEEHDWNHRLILRQLMNAVRTGDKTVFTTYCHDLAVRRFSEGFSAEEFCGALELLNLICLRILRRDPDSGGMRQQMIDYLTMTLRFGCDEAQDTFEMKEARLAAQWPTSV